MPNTRTLADQAARRRAAEITAAILTHDLDGMEPALRYAERIARNSRQSNPNMSDDYTRAAAVLRARLAAVSKDRNHA